MTLSIFFAWSQCELPKSNSSPQEECQEWDFGEMLENVPLSTGCLAPSCYLPKGCLLCLLLKIWLHHLPCVYIILQRQGVKPFEKHWVLNLYNKVQAEQELPSLGNFLAKLRVVFYSQQMCLVTKQPPSPIFWLSSRDSPGLTAGLSLWP